MRRQGQQRPVGPSLQHLEPEPRQNPGHSAGGESVLIKASDRLRAQPAKADQHAVERVEAWRRYREDPSGLQDPPGLDETFARPLLEVLTDSRRVHRVVGAVGDVAQLAYIALEQP